MPGATLQDIRHTKENSSNPKNERDEQEGQRATDIATRDDDLTLRLGIARFDAGLAHPALGTYFRERCDLLTTVLAELRVLCAARVAALCGISGKYDSLTHATLPDRNPHNIGFFDIGISVLLI
jgi:hypothetical protein